MCRNGFESSRVLTRLFMFGLSRKGDTFKVFFAGGGRRGCSFLQFGTQRNLKKRNPVVCNLTTHLGHWIRLI